MAEAGRPAEQRATISIGGATTSASSTRERKPSISSRRQRMMEDVAADDCLQGRVDQLYKATAASASMADSGTASGAETRVFSSSTSSRSSNGGGRSGGFSTPSLARCVGVLAETTRRPPCACARRPGVRCCCRRFHCQSAS